jgi:hypothetical protein
MCKEIWVAASENLEALHGRVPTDTEIEAEYQDLCAAYADRKDSEND